MSFHSQKRPDFAALRGLPILSVAQLLGLSLVKTSSCTYAMRDGREISSLVVFEKTNSWHRFSDKKSGGVSRGSTIDLVSHVRDCSFREAVEFLDSHFPQYR